jgi:hypothetical protein
VAQCAGRKVLEKRREVSESDTNLCGEPVRPVARSHLHHLSVECRIVLLKSSADVLTSAESMALLRFELLVQTRVYESERRALTAKALAPDALVPSSTSADAHSHFSRRQSVMPGSPFTPQPLQQASLLDSPRQAAHSTHGRSVAPLDRSPTAAPAPDSSNLIAPHIAHLSHTRVALVISDIGNGGCTLQQYIAVSHGGGTPVGAHVNTGLPGSTPRTTSSIGYDRRYHLASLLSSSGSFGSPAPSTPLPAASPSASCTWRC